MSNIEKINQQDVTDKILARAESFYTKKRVPLHEHIPLDMPFAMGIEISSLCDLKCRFCAHSSTDFFSQLGHVHANMSDETISLLIEQLREFPRPLKTIWISGLGEALLHPKLSSIISAIKKDGLTERIALITNGVRLSNSISNDIVEAGLDSITISVNGLSSEEYFANCGTRIDFDSYLSKLTYLYTVKGAMEMNIKTVDAFVRDKQQQELFYQIFGKICDRINVERIFPRYGGFSYEGLIQDKSTRSRYDEIDAHRSICSAPFFRMFVGSSGKVNCCGYPDGVASENMNLRTKSLIDIWTSEEHKHIMLSQLQERYEGITSVCESCGSRECYAFEQDNLDPYAIELYERIRNI